MSFKILTPLKSFVLAGSLLIGPSSFAKNPVSVKSVGTERIKPVSVKSVGKERKQSSALDIALLKSSFASWGVDPSNTKSSINLPKAWMNFKQKKEIVVAVIDTGIDPYHPFLKDNLYVPKGTVSPLTNYGVDFSKNRKSATRPFDDHGHGTHVSGIIKSVFPKVKILALKYYDRKADGKANLKSTIDALRYAVEQNVDIINYSGGGPQPDSQELEILKKAEARGILVVAAAGNEKSNIDQKDNAYYPASYPLNNIITVTAHDQNLRVLSSSNYGKSNVDIAAPGYKIGSSSPRGRVGQLTGTSQATAFVTGVAAMIKAQFPELSTQKIISAINQSAKKEITLAVKCASGGRLDATKAQQVAAQFTMMNQKRKLASKSNNDQGKIIYRIK
ncbi:S8 family peptidase [Halobacteriovorax sp. GB3]|uniref:S8 family peptidase n=1 Tax=Halobacteriovorax sp. GB3 TaxID=2719615 RepID=UPI00235DF91E|nr:S8 family peptidase [Halobacteriovorax sp. GB3]MDD0854062.1 S8 family peptidase [Halobacteriovorax sp. GB3]